MSETDKYLEAAKRIIRAGTLWDVRGGFDAAAYLREHFVTREEYDESQTALRNTIIDMIGYWNEIDTITAERDRFRVALERVSICYPGWSSYRVDGLRNLARQALNPEDV